MYLFCDTAPLGQHSVRRGREVLSGLQVFFPQKLAKTETNITKVLLGMHLNMRHFKNQVAVTNDQVKWDIDHEFNTSHPKSLSNLSIRKCYKHEWSFRIVTYGNKFIHI